MNKQVKQKWVKALKSGKYKQGRSKLRNLNNEFCCIGVLCDLYLKENKQKWLKNEDNFYLKFENNFNHTATIPSVVKEWSELDDPWAFYTMNDRDNTTFPEIALYIENGL